MGANHLNEKQRQERLGEIRLNNQNIPMKIIEYIKNDKVLIEFEDGYQKYTTYCNFKNGEVRNPNIKKRVHNDKKAERINQIEYNNEGYKMRIIQYINAGDIIVEFDDEYHGQVHTDYKRFIEGEVRNPYRPGIFGEITGNKYSTKNSTGEKLKEYNLWRAMLNRVFNFKSKAYEKVTICQEWLYYPNFIEWLQKQPNYIQWKNGKDREWCIDKDILSEVDNKIYSPNTCCLIPTYINLFVIDRGRKNNKKSKLPVGVYSYHNKKYYCHDTNGKVFIYDTIEEAQQQYINFRNAKRKQMAEEAYNKNEITQQCYEALIDDNFLFRKKICRI